jgi:hypothetical protein
MESTQIVAWWGALVATLVLLWDIMKWHQSGARLRKRISLNVHYDDGKIISKQIIKDGLEGITYEEYCHVELVNIGNMPTTVMNISASHKKKKDGFKLGSMQQAFTEHFGKKLPHVISPGEVWSCRLGMSYYKSLLKYGRPEIYINLSHLKRPLLVRATRSANRAVDSN